MFSVFLTIFSLVMAVWWTYFGARVLIRGHLYLPHDSSHWMFTHSLHGLPAILAGLGFISFGAVWLIIVTPRRWIARYCSLTAGFLAIALFVLYATLILTAEYFRK